jgi:hypothetical protein
VCSGLPDVIIQPGHGRCHHVPAPGTMPQPQDEQDRVVLSSERDSLVAVHIADPLSSNHLGEGVVIITLSLREKQSLMKGSDILCSVHRHMCYGWMLPAHHNTTVYHMQAECFSQDACLCSTMRASGQMCQPLYVEITSLEHIKSVTQDGEWIWKIFPNRTLGSGV